MRRQLRLRAQQGHQHNAPALLFFLRQQFGQRRQRRVREAGAGAGHPLVAAFALFAHPDQLHQRLGMVHAAYPLSAQVIVNVGRKAGDTGDALFAHHRRVPDAAVVIIVKQIFRLVRLQRFDHLRVAGDDLQPFRRLHIFVRQYPTGDIVHDILAFRQQERHQRLLPDGHIRQRGDQFIHAAPPERLIRMSQMGAQAHVEQRRPARAGGFGAESHLKGLIIIIKLNVLQGDKHLDGIFQTVNVNNLVHQTGIISAAPAAARGYRHLNRQRRG